MQSKISYRVFSNDEWYVFWKLSSSRPQIWQILKRNDLIKKWRGLKVRELKCAVTRWRPFGLKGHTNSYLMSMPNDSYSQNFSFLTCLVVMNKILKCCLSYVYGQIKLLRYSWEGLIFCLIDRKWCVVFEQYFCL